MLVNHSVLGDANTANSSLARASVSIHRCLFPLAVFCAAILGHFPGSATRVYGGLISNATTTTTVRWSLLTSGSPSASTESFVFEYQPPPATPDFRIYDTAVWNLAGTAYVDSPFVGDDTFEGTTFLVFSQALLLQINSLAPGSFLSTVGGVPNDSLSMEIETILTFSLNSPAVIFTGSLGQSWETDFPIDHAEVWSKPGIGAIGTSISSPPTPDLTVALQQVESNGQSAPFAAGVHSVQLLSRAWTQDFDATGYSSVVAFSEFELNLGFAPYTAAIPEPSSQVLVICLFASVLFGRVIDRKK